MIDSSGIFFFPVKKNARSIDLIDLPYTEVLQDILLDIIRTENAINNK